MFGKLFKRGDDGEEQARRALARELRAEANYFASVIVERLTQLNICYRHPRSKRDFLQSAVQQVVFVRAVGTPEAIYLMVDNRRLPRGVRVSDLADDEILNDLSVACRRNVRFRYQVDAGAWFIIERRGGAWGIPRTFSIALAMENWPSTSLKQLLVPLGVGENRRVLYRSLAELPHALIGGATGAGKTTLLHAWICSLVMHNAPSELNLVLIDLKGGVEFTRYRALPHMLSAEGIPGGFVKDTADVIPTLEFLRDTMDRRLERFENAGGIQNIGIWNYRHRHERMARLVLFVDELAVIMLDRKLKSKSEALLADISARGRAPGVHIVLSTQRPEVKVVSGLIKANLDARIAFRVTDNTSSVVILDDGAAARFGDDAPPGRFIYKRGLERLECQAPLITEGQISQIVSGLISGQLDDEAVRVAPEDVLALSVRQLQGRLAVRDVYDALDGRVSYRYISELLKTFDGQVVEVDGVLYNVVPGAGRKPRQLVPVGADDSADDAKHNVNGGEHEVTEGIAETCQELA